MLPLVRAWNISRGIFKELMLAVVYGELKKEEDLVFMVVPIFTV